MKKDLSKGVGRITTAILAKRNACPTCDPTRDLQRRKISSNEKRRRGERIYRPKDGRPHGMGGGSDWRA